MTDDELEQLAREAGQNDKEIVHILLHTYPEFLKRLLSLHRKRVMEEKGFYIQCQHCEGEGDEPHTDNDVCGPATCSVCHGNRFIKAIRAAAEREE